MPNSKLEIVELDNSEDIREQLADMLMETVAGGATLNFMHPLAKSAALAFWQKSFESVASGNRIILGALDGTRLVGTLSILLDCGDNQSHRCEIGKVMTSLSHRGKGIGSQLVAAAERTARARQRSLMVVTTATGGTAHNLYERMGFVHAGTIPYFGSDPYGKMEGCMFYWKQIEAQSQAAAT
ncbi:MULTISPECIES: GNAT family N-acetyltransferase [unclassified Bradyrhizobium]|uniref:GNAT family N-acetyltransferase n=1 Tax=unclassified Bradyrhizobium TaxID=2631580 RepID=UPI002916E406|nr:MULTISPECIES: GNAT family N-acetyltransferase [unclassified Bradyrhizobium]